MVIKIEQTVNISPPFFTMPIEIKINYAAGDTTIKLFNNAQIQEYLINLPYKPMSIIFDPDNWILKDVLSIINGVEGEDYPSEFFLSQNYPNPFNPITTIQYQIPKQSFVTLKVYDVLGNEIVILVNEENPAGTYEISWHADNLPSGIYFYKLQSGSFVETKKMVLLK